MRKISPAQKYPINVTNYQKNENTHNSILISLPELCGTTFVPNPVLKPVSNNYGNGYVKVVYEGVMNCPHIIH
jgi:hypothetical protein